MRQVLLDSKPCAIIVWAPDSYSLGDTVRWNGIAWRVSAVYGTHFCSGFEARKREKPDEDPLEKFN